MRTKTMLAIVLACFTLVLIASAWQCDDAFISWRTADNFWRGEGLTWNAGERVQTYTSPLWMLVAVASHGVFGEAYFSMLAISILLAITMLYLLSYCVFPDRIPAALMLLTLSTSAAVIDYSTSGLENPLLGCLLVLFVMAVIQTKPTTRLPLSVLVGGLIVLTRLDALLFVFPVLAWLAWRQRRQYRHIALAALALLPFFAWELFAFLYYGELLPNTARAKLNLEISSLELGGQGLLYIADSFMHDPVSLIVVATGLLVGLKSQRTRIRMLSLGVLLYLLYILRIGGDFMSGRFIFAPVIVSASIIGLRCRRITNHFKLSQFGLLAAVVIIYGLACPSCRWFVWKDYVRDVEVETTAAHKFGITDERAYYCPQTSLMWILRKWPIIKEQSLPVPPYRGAIKGLALRDSDNTVAVVGEVGYFGYQAGPGKQIIDVFALCDPLLSRIPYVPDGEWRVGHYGRAVPMGYVETKMYSQNHLVDPELAALYDDIHLVTTGPLFTKERWKAIWRLHVGRRLTGIEQKVAKDAKAKRLR